MSEKEEVTKKKKPAAKKTTAKKTTAKKTTAKKATPRKTAAKKTAAKKAEKKVEVKPVTKPEPKSEPKPEPKPELSIAELRESADGIVKNYMWWSAGAGLLPVPVVDALAISTVQMKMIADLCKLYDVEFSEKLVKSFIATLLGSVAALGLRRSFLTKILRAIPVIGLTASVSLTFYAAATTYAVGNVFIHHFEEGGDLLDFELEKCKELYHRHFKKAASEAKAAEAK